MSYSGIRAGIAANIGSGWNHYDGYTPDQWVTPAVIVELGPIQYREAMQRGHVRTRATVTVVVADSEHRSAQSQLDAAVAPSGTGSVVALIESDSTLGGEVSDSYVSEMTGYSRIQNESGATFLTAPLLVEIYL